MAKSLDIIDPKRDDQNEPDESIVSDDELKVETKGQGGVFYLVMGIVALVVATAAALYILYKDDNPNKSTDSVESVQSATVTASTSPGVSVTSTASSVATRTAKAEVNFKEDKVRVANGNGVNGEGAKIKTILEGKGFAVTSVGNATKQYDKSIVFYQEGKESLANAIKEAIQDEYTADIELSPSTVGQYDAVLALGSK